MRERALRILFILERVLVIVDLDAAEQCAHLEDWRANGLENMGRARDIQITRNDMKWRHYRVDQKYTKERSIDAHTQIQNEQCILS